jgi:phosphomannomutase
VDAELGGSWQPTDDLVAAYVAAFVRGFPDTERLYLGRDLRASSPRIAGTVAAAASGTGLEVLDCGVLPTPALALAAAGQLAVMVTGSHIPADRNGLKFYRPDGEIGKDDEARLVAEVAAGGVVPLVAGAVSESGAARAGYVARYLGFWPGDALAGLRVGFWAQSSAARDVLPEVLTGLGAEVVEIDRRADFLAVDTEAVPEDWRRAFRGWAAEHGLDAIVSTDGDADRPLLTDGAGDVVPGDILGPVTARALGAGRIVTPVSSNTMVDDMFPAGAVTRCRIGSPYVIAGMAAPGGRVIGYEPNGGVLLGYEAEAGGRRLAPMHTRDSALPIVSVLAEAVKAGSVAALVAGLPARRTATDRLQDIPKEVSAGIVDEIFAGDYSILPEALGAPVAIDRLEGARMTFAGGEIVTIRPSGNAPELRCYAEAETEARARSLMRTALEKLRARVGR